jgi:hypothetical protein
MSYVCLGANFCGNYCSHNNKFENNAQRIYWLNFLTTFLFVTIVATPNHIELTIALCDSALQSLNKGGKMWENWVSYIQEYILNYMLVTQFS